MTVPGKRRSLGAAIEYNSVKLQKEIFKKSYVYTVTVSITISVADPDLVCMFLGLLDPDPDPVVRGTDQDPSIIKQK